MIPSRFTACARAACACALFALTAATPHAASAQAVPAADPQAAVPPVAYQPALSYQTPAAPASTPDRAWRASNEAVTRKAPGAAAMQDEHAGHAGMTMPPAADAPQQCKPGNGTGCGCCKKMAESGSQQCMQGGAKDCCCGGMHGHGGAA